jgi:hypothetical protein
MVKTAETRVAAVDSNPEGLIVLIYFEPKKVAERECWVLIRFAESAST